MITPTLTTPSTAPSIGAMTPPRIVLVAGTGRSGTSTLAGILRRLGLHVPQPEVAADASNPKGFGEPQWVVDFHDELLDRAGVQVSDARPVAWERAARAAEDPAVRRRLGGWLTAQLDAGGQVLVKDPRLLWFVPLWSDTARDAGLDPAFVTMLRPPAEVIGSKRSQYNRGLADPHGAAAWLNLVLGTERATRGATRAYVDYHRLLADWAQPVDDLVARLGLTVTDGPSVRAEVTEFVDPGLRRVRAGDDELELPDRLATLVQGAWMSLGELADDPTAPAPQAELDDVATAYAAYYAESESVARSSVIAAAAAPRPSSRQRRPMVTRLTSALRRSFTVGS